MVCCMAATLEAFRSRALERKEHTRALLLRTPHDKALITRLQAIEEDLTIALEYEKFKRTKTRTGLECYRAGYLKALTTLKGK
jgi:hypothetical protein